MTSVTKFWASLLLGLVVAVVIGLAIDGGSQPTTPPSTTTTTVLPAESTVEPWFEVGEAVIGTTVILPRELEVEDGMVVLDYDLVGLGPVFPLPDADDSTPGGGHPTLPESWILTTTSGETFATTTGPFDSSARFEVPDGSLEVASIRLVGWRVAIPFGERVELSTVTGESAVMRNGTITIETVLEQSVSTIVQIDFDASDEVWGFFARVLPLDSTWRTSGRQGGGLQLLWEGVDAPPTVVFEDAGFGMRPVAGDILVLSTEDAL